MRTDRRTPEPADDQITTGAITQLTGVVARTVPDRGFFFARCDQDGHDYFCHVSSLVGCEMADVQTGGKVCFIGTKTEKGWRADRIQLV